MTAEKVIRIALIEDHLLVRRGIRTLLEADATISVVGEGATAQDALSLVEREHPDVIILDLSLPDGSGIALIDQLKRESAVKVVVLTMHDASEMVSSARAAGCDAYLLKGGDLAELRAAISAVAAGETYFAAQISNIEGAANRDPMARLSARERQVLQLIAEGNTSRRIAELLGISFHTVNAHRVNLMDKLDLHDAQGLTRFALRHGLVSTEK